MVTHSSVVKLKSNKSQEKPVEIINLNKSRKSLVENELNKIGNINETRNGYFDLNSLILFKNIISFQIKRWNIWNWWRRRRKWLQFHSTLSVNVSMWKHLYESIQNSAIVFQHDFTSDTLKCVKTNNLNEINNIKSN